MSRRFLALPVLGLVLAPLLALGLSACGGSDPDPKADPTPSTTPTPSPSTTPSPTAQPSGANGVTIRVLNWDAYADQPAVLAWKTTFEAGEASANLRRLLPQVVNGTTGKIRRTYVSGIHLGWDNRWHVPKVAFARVQSLKGSARRTTLTMCSWQPSFSYYKKDGRAAGPNPRQWTRWRYTMRSAAGQWVVTAQAKTGTCPGGAPT